MVKDTSDQATITLVQSKELFLEEIEDSTNLWKVAE